VGFGLPALVVLVVRCGFSFLSSSGGEADFICSLGSRFTEAANATRPNAANQTEQATARPTAATTGDEDATEEDNRTHARTAPAN